MSTRLPHAVHWARCLWFCEDSGAQTYPSGTRYENCTDSWFFLLAKIPSTCQLCHVRSSASDQGFKGHALEVDAGTCSHFAEDSPNPLRINPFEKFVIDRGTVGISVVNSFNGFSDATYCLLQQKDHLACSAGAILDYIVSAIKSFTG